MNHPSIRDPGIRDAIVGRLQGLSPDGERRWGRMAYTKLFPTWRSVCHSHSASRAERPGGLCDSPRCGGAHPSFGTMAPRDWDVLVYRHLDHHLAQFGG